MKTRFIILIDFSEYSAALIKYAYDWSLRYPAELLLVHQTSVMVPALSEARVKETIAKYDNAEAMQKLKQLVAETLPLTALVSYSVSEINLSKVLDKLLQESYNNLIFLGLKGTGLLKRIFIGSTTLQLMNSINNLIVAVPKEVDKFSCEKIYVAVTEKYPLNILALKKYLLFLGKEQAQINFFYLAKPKEQTEHIEKKLIELKQLFSGGFQTSTAIYQGNDAFEAVKKIINNKIEEILIVQKGSRLLNDQLFRKFLINDLVYHGQTPMVILP